MLQVTIPASPEMELWDYGKQEFVTKKAVKGTISPVQDKTIRNLFKDNKKELSAIMKSLKKVKIEELSREEASEIIKNKKGEK